MRDSGCCSRVTGEGQPLGGNTTTTRRRASRRADEYLLTTVELLEYAQALVLRNELGAASAVVLVAGRVLAKAAGRR